MPASTAYGESGLGVLDGLPCGDRVAATRPQPGKPEMELHEAVLRIELRELLEPVVPRGPGGEREPDLRLEGVVPREELRGGAVVAPRVEVRTTCEVASLGIGPEAERERERRPPRARLRLHGRLVRAVTGGDDGDRDDGDGGRRGERDEAEDARARGHAATIAVGGAPQAWLAGREPAAIVRKVMAGYRELLARVKDEIDEISTLDAHERHQSPDSPLFVDVREPDEWEEGHIPGAIYTGRGRLEQRIEGLVPDKTRPLVVYCSAGSRSAFAAKALEELGYENVVNLAGGFSDWKRNGFETTIPRVLTASSAPATAVTSSSRRSARKASSACSTRASS